jgi:hypothetical protein
VNPAAVPQLAARPVHNGGMANGILSFPFRLGPDGSVVTVGYGTDPEIEEAIAVLALTHIGERPMRPEFGIPDPTFAGLHTGDIQVGLDDYGPAGVMVTAITTETVSDTVDRAKISWRRTSDGTEQNNG